MGAGGCQGSSASVCVREDVQYVCERMLEEEFFVAFSLCNMVIMHVCLFFFFFTDVDECALAAVTGLQACQGDAECKNTHGSFTCSCPSGYVMALNGKNCIGEAHMWYVACVCTAFFLQG